MGLKAVDAMGSGRKRYSSGPKGAGLRRMHETESYGSLLSAGASATVNAGRGADEST
jgi:hypothetical protein